MALEDDFTSTGKTTRKTIGSIPVSKLAKSPEFRSYMECSKAFSAAKAKSLEAKEAVRELLRKKSTTLRDLEGALEFSVSGDSLQIFEIKGQKGRRGRGAAREIELS
jgi:hypothetical protein